MIPKLVTLLLALTMVAGCSQQNYNHESERLPQPNQVKNHAGNKDDREQLEHARERLRSITFEGNESIAIKALSSYLISFEHLSDLKNEESLKLLKISLSKNDAFFRDILFHEAIQLLIEEPLYNSSEWDAFKFDEQVLGQTIEPLSSSELRFLQSQGPLESARGRIAVGRLIVMKYYSDLDNRSTMLEAVNKMASVTKGNERKFWDLLSSELDEY